MARDPDTTEHDGSAEARLRSRVAVLAEPMRAALDGGAEAGRWAAAAKSASQLSDLHLGAGFVAEGVYYAQESVMLADRSADPYQQGARREVLANALHQAGRLADAESIFHRAEEIHRARQPEYPLLFSVGGYYYCDLLLSLGRHEEALRRARQTLAWAERRGLSALALALDHLTIGNALLLAHGREPAGLVAAGESFKEAIDQLRALAQPQELPRGLIARAELHRTAGALDRARADLDEALAISARLGMRLHEIDARLGLARLELAEGHEAGALQAIAPLRRMIQSTGYRRREGVLLQLEARSERLVSAAAPPTHGVSPDAGPEQGGVGRRTEAARLAVATAEAQSMQAAQRTALAERQESLFADLASARRELNAERAAMRREREDLARQRAAVTKPGENLEHRKRARARHSRLRRFRQSLVRLHKPDPTPARPVMDPPPASPLATVEMSGRERPPAAWPHRQATMLAVAAVALAALCLLALGAASIAIARRLSPPEWRATAAIDIAADTPVAPRAGGDPEPALLADAVLERTIDQLALRDLRLGDTPQDVRERLRERLTAAWSPGGRLLLEYRTTDPQRSVLVLESVCAATSEAPDRWGAVTQRAARDLEPIRDRRLPVAAAIFLAGVAVLAVGIASLRRKLLASGVALPTFSATTQTGRTGVFPGASEPPQPRAPDSSRLRGRAWPWNRRRGDEGRSRRNSETAWPPETPETPEHSESAGLDPARGGADP